MNYLPYRDGDISQMGGDLISESGGETNITGLKAPQASPDKPKTEEPMNQLEKEMKDAMWTARCNAVRAFNTADYAKIGAEVALKWIEKALRDTSEHTFTDSKGKLMQKVQDVYVAAWMEENGLKTQEVSNTSEPISEGLRVDFDINNPDRVTPGN